MKGIIYLVVNNDNGKMYIGQTKYTFDFRKKEHINEAKRGEGFYFHKALRKYKFNFTWKILEDGIELSELDNRERYYIKLYDTFNSSNGYNLTSGGDFCRKVKYSKKEIEFILEKRYEFRGLKEILNLFNVEFSRELKNVYSIDKIIKKLINERDEKEIKFQIKSKNSRERIETPNSRLNRSKSQLGKKHVPETIEKLRKIKTGIKHSKESIEKVRKNNSRTIRFTNDEVKFILNNIEIGLSKRKTLMMLNEKFGYNINLTSTSVIDRILKENT